ncbi:hypothetical protein B7486_45365 [cyanobacterium TDX16]|nr:hypothetical protein B7486_45365 [cyanobacterium TDX16]
MKNNHALSLSKLFLKYRPQRSQAAQKSRGFTLIELLIAMVMSSIILGALLTFINTLLNSERQEQAKATTEQEIQAALDYIAQDLQQAVYIYDADGLNNTYTNATDTTPGIQDQIPPVADRADGCGSSTPTCVPVLVFWKREYKQGVMPVTGITDKDDTFVYSLVAYFLTKGDSSNIWSNNARIRRFQIQGGVVNPTTPTNTNGSPNYITGETPSNGFMPFNLTVPGSTLQEKMNRWQKATTSKNIGNAVDYNAEARVLIDFVDKNITDITPNCSTGTQQVPSTLVGGFYACVNSAKTIAQVFVRGNALARLNPNNTYNSTQSVYFPTTSIHVKGRGFLGSQTPPAKLVA